MRTKVNIISGTSPFGLQKHVNEFLAKLEAANYTLQNIQFTSTSCGGGSISVERTAYITYLVNH